MNILALDTSTEACSVALSVNGEVHERFELARHQHTELILPMMEALLSEAQITLKDIDRLAVGRGPGSFTGVRIGVGIAQGLALSNNMPIAAVSSLAALAQGAYRLYGWKQVIAATDARMSEVYTSHYRLDANGLMQALEHESLMAPEQLAAPQEGEWYAVGTAWAEYEDRIPILASLNKIDSTLLTHAQDVATLAASVSDDELVAADSLEPIYLRNEVAWKKSK